MGGFIFTHLDNMSSLVFFSLYLFLLKYNLFIGLYYTILIAIELLCLRSEQLYQRPSNLLSQSRLQKWRKHYKKIRSILYFDSNRLKIKVRTLAFTWCSWFMNTSEICIIMNNLSIHELIEKNCEKSWKFFWRQIKISWTHNSDFNVNIQTISRLLLKKKIIDEKNVLILCGHKKCWKRGRKSIQYFLDK